MRKRGIVAVGIGLAALGATAAGAGLRRFAIAESSMEPALEPGDWVVARRRRRPPRRGDIVVFTDPLDADRWLVKRVVGLPGEHLEISDGVIRIDGAVLDEPWANGPTRPPDLWEIPEDAVFLLGDRRSVSTGDGRQTGPIPLDAVGWRVVARYWPPGRAATF